MRIPSEQTPTFRLGGTNTRATGGGTSPILVDDWQLTGTTGEPLAKVSVDWRWGGEGAYVCVQVRNVLL